MRFGHIVCMSDAHRGERVAALDGLELNEDGRRALAGYALAFSDLGDTGERFGPQTRDEYAAGHELVGALNLDRGEYVVYAEGNVEVFASTFERDAADFIAERVVRQGTWG